MAKIVIIGGGISGLSAAYELSKDGRHQVSLVEAGPRLGGKVGTHRDGELLIEQGPDSIFTMKPWAVELMEELGMQDELVSPTGSEFSILVDGKLHHVPRALATLMPSASGVLEKVGFLSAAAKKRVMAEGEAPKGSGADESIASFFRRRFGKRFSSLVAEPLLAGIHAGDPEKLSMKALYPTYVGMEQKHGSLSNRTTPPPPPSGAPRKATFLTLREGMQSFVDRLIESLGDTCVFTDTPIESIERSGSGLVLKGARSFEADQVILAVPAYAAAKMLRNVASATADVLERIRFVSTAIVTLAYPNEAFPKGLHGNGFLVPYAEKADITGCTWSSSKWPDRAPEGTALLRVFMGQDGGLQVDEHTEEQLAEKAQRAMKKILGTKLPPSFVRVDRWTRAMPQYEIGHLDLLAEAEAGLGDLPIRLIGSSYRGNGIPDCVRQGREAARSIVEQDS